MLETRIVAISTLIIQIILIPNKALLKPFSHHFTIKIPHKNRLTKRLLFMHGINIL